MSRASHQNAADLWRWVVFVVDHGLYSRGVLYLVPTVRAWELAKTADCFVRKVGHDDLLLFQGLVEAGEI